MQTFQAKAHRLEQEARIARATRRIGLALLAVLIVATLAHAVSKAIASHAHFAVHVEGLM